MNITISIEAHLVQRLERKIEMLNRASFSNFNKSNYIESLLVKENETEHIRFLAKQKNRELFGLMELLQTIEAEKKPVQEALII